ncbi:MAG: NFACT family protein [Spirochaetales bacterium]|nr:NFACT family protein [Spirochaetales bacterium]MCF7937873.1 NFACT family protein [Spirochaetales bacterium]
MGLNWAEIDLILEEAEFPGDFVRKIRQPSYNEMFLQLHGEQGNRNLFISLDHRAMRFHITRRGFPKSGGALRFAQFLASRIGGARFAEVYQLGRERVVKFTLTKGVEKDFETTLLWLRLWGGAANMIVTDREGTILDVWYRRPRRGEVTGGFYHPELDSSLVSSSDFPGRIRDLPGEGSFQERLDNHYLQSPSSTETGDVIERARALFERRCNALRSALERIRKQLDSAADETMYREYGDLIFASLRDVENKLTEGSSSITLESYRFPGTHYEIPLSAGLSAPDQAQAYYRRAGKIASRKERLENEEKQVRRELEDLEERREKILNDPDYAQSFLKKHQPPEKPRVEEGRPGLAFRSGLHTILVGRNDRENDELLRRHTRGNDTSLHVRNAPGS